MDNDVYKREYTREFVSRWDRLIGWTGRRNAENGFFERLLRARNCTTVADIASGTGYHAIMLADAGFDVTASDGSAAMVRKTQDNARAMRVDLKDVAVVDWRELANTFGHNRFDALLCLGNAFTHLFEHDARCEALEAMRAILKPGGLAAIDHRNYDKILDQGYSSKHRYYYTGDDVDARPVKIRSDMVRFEYAYADGETFHLTLYPLRQQYLSELLDRTGFVNLTRYGDFEARYDPDDADFIQQIAFKPRH